MKKAIAADSLVPILPEGSTSITRQQMAMLVKFIVEEHGKKPLPEGDTTASVSSTRFGYCKSWIRLMFRTYSNSWLSRTQGRSDNILYLWEICEGFVKTSYIMQL